MALHSLVMAATYLAAGKLALKFGEKRIFVLGALIFASGVIVAALSPSIWVLLLGWSMIKPIGGAMMIPAASSLIVLNYAGKQRTAAFGIFSAFVAAAAVIGPVWMGALANLISWRWAFASEPVLIALLLFFASMVTEAKRTQKAPFDSLGALLTFIGFALLVLGATLAGEFGWWTARRPFYIGDEVFAPFGLSAAVVFMLGGVALLMIYAAWAEWRARRDLAPLFQVRVFRNRSFSVAAALGFCFQLAVGGLFLVWKGVKELRVKAKGVEHEVAQAGKFKDVVTLIVGMNLLFSADSILTVVGMTDAFPIMGSMTRWDGIEEYDSRMLCGQPTLQPRLKDIPTRIPQPQPDVPISIYEIQKGLKSRAFETIS